MNQEVNNEVKTEENQNETEQNTENTSIKPIETSKTKKVINTISVIIVLILAIVTVYAIVTHSYSDEYDTKTESTETTEAETTEAETTEAETTEAETTEAETTEANAVSDLNGEITLPETYQHAVFDSFHTVEAYMEVVSYKGYIKKLDEAKSIQGGYRDDSEDSINETLTEYYTDKSSNYLVLYESSGSQFCTMELTSVTKSSCGIIVEGYREKRGTMAGGSGYFIAIPTTLPVGTNVEFDNQYEEGFTSFSDMSADKPVIYLYPEETTDVNVTLNLNGELTCTYPKYNSTYGWNVTAEPDGTLTDESGQTYNYLYWEGTVDVEWDFSQGFCVKGSETADFLETALAELGLTREEANEFIVYWLPQMEQNEYNLISFQSDVYTNNAELKVNPEPDTTIRVFMAYKALDKEVDIEPQTLTAQDRVGFTVVEWGGTKVEFNNQ
jgi:cytoskeletal protein RodZ